MWGVAEMKVYIAWWSDSVEEVAGIRILHESAQRIGVFIDKGVAEREAERVADDQKGHGVRSEGWVEEVELDQVAGWATRESLAEDRVVR